MSVGIVYVKTWEISTFFSFQSFSFFLNCEQDAPTIDNTDAAGLDIS
ncbi:MAG: hypothetical protein F6K25_26460 [Okeania sp. SIO2G4]|nr:MULTISPECIES: hypothetical protein [unclassified Okeania]NEP04017.1 hypothetical protein [Okeania sp. SIO4D6]NEP38926.1 hypothetical protein [Okeania sp. SIO2H7]NEP73386.1 hypothetical protein [Okeania sp. SIO2G5]NEP96894.1 hypothetical protein [Okeania sp. SIO2F5]NEQ94004.1 hypothetical protein [Okeania sp. SIO2G4]